MYAAQLLRSAAAGALILGCWVSLCSPVVAAPADVGSGATAPDKANASPTGVGSEFELTFWQSVSASDDADQLQAYLARYPDGVFSGLARAKIAALTRRGDATSGGAATLHTAAPATPKAEATPPAGTDDGDLVGPAAAIPGASTPVAKTPVPTGKSPAQVTKVVQLTPVPPQPAEAAVAATTEARPASQTASAPAAVSPELAERLRVLGQSQGRRPEAVAERPYEPPAYPPSASPAPQQLIAIPSRPKLARVPKVDLPDHFCTTMERHNFYNSVYQPARSLADQNDRAATGHMLKLQSIYDDYVQRQDQAATDAIAVEVRDYETLASDVHHASTAFEDMFDSLMAVPIRECGEAL